MGDLGIDTAVAGRDGHYTAQMSRDWEIWGPNGGYVASIALRAAGAHSRFDRPASLVGHFLGVAGFDSPVDLEVTTLREAKRAESIRVSMTQRGNPIFDAMVWAVGDVSGLEHEVLQMPVYPDPETLPTVREKLEAAGVVPTMTFKFWGNFDERPVTWVDDWENREPTLPVAEGWYRYVPRDTFADDAWLDACRSVILLDTMGWPAVCRLHTRSDYIAPSIDLSIGFHRQAPAEPWLFVQATAPSGNAGVIGCESRVWSRGGSLLAVGASQLLCRPGQPF
jgi:acyl-CoA thioesterase II